MRNQNIPNFGSSVGGGTSTAYTIINEAGEYVVTGPASATGIIYSLNGGAEVTVDPVTLPHTITGSNAGHGGDTLTVRVIGAEREIVPPIAAAPLIVDFTATAPDSSTLELSWSQDVDTTVTFILSINPTTPTAIQIEDGVDANDDPAAATWVDAATGTSGTGSATIDDVPIDDYYVYAAFRAGGLATVVSDGPVSIGVPAGPTFADSEVPADFTNAAWGSLSTTGGWLIKPATNPRADSSSGDMAVPPAGVLTLVFDVRVNGTAGTVSARIWENAAGGANNQPFWNTSTFAFTAGGMSSGGMIYMGGGVYRCWTKKTIAAGRLIVDIPISANTNHDFTNPSFFYADLSTGEIEELV